MDIPDSTDMISDADQTPRLSSDLIVVANRLPISRDDTGVSRLNPGGLVTALAPILAEAEGVWIGWNGSARETPPPTRTGGVIMSPVSLSADEVEGYYDGMSNSTFWPLYHGAFRQPIIEPRWWDPYVAVNRRFADAASAAVSDHGTVWVHDYHQQLVPAMVRQARPGINISFFCHTPFPAAELFLRLPWRKEIILGMLGADMVGFQTPRDVDNFLSVCSHLLPHLERQTSDRQGQLLLHDDREIRIGSHPISIDTHRVEALALTDSCQRNARKLRAELGNPRHVLLGIDRLDYTKGIDARLQALTVLLREGRVDPADIAFIQIASPSREDVIGYEATRRIIEQQVSAINGEFSTLGRPVVHYQHKTFDFEDLVPMYLAADVMVVTPYRDGMNLVAKEYVACRTGDSGVLLLSEFAGAAHEFSAALQCNPFDSAGLAARLHEALSVGTGEARQRMGALRRVVQRNDVHRWAADVLAPTAPARLVQVGYVS